MTPIELVRKIAPMFPGASVSIEFGAWIYSDGRETEQWTAYVGMKKGIGHAAGTAEELLAWAEKNRIDGVDSQK